MFSSAVARALVSPFSSASLMSFAVMRSASPMPMSSVLRTSWLDTTASVAAMMGCYLKGERWTTTKKKNYKRVCGMLRTVRIHYAKYTLCTLAASDVEGGGEIHLSRKQIVMNRHQ
ncbi:hypothetical protein STCU_11428 [Strigomonas culicis]|uniref:Uncharacterized protein n=1 Tax=Strigomonas culicis TaxID=28005 RepID=S9V0G2_9TRYP|nr:hypothetical protein STCU_11428 [Strigomonas culicis]|eukprot:EPY16275.1 hypothetical protein STCU_11428 [Strigomonas culicis]